MLEISNGEEYMKSRVRTQKKTSKMSQSSNSVRAIKLKHVVSPFQILAEDIMTGYLGEQMHQDMKFLSKKERKSSD